MPLTDEQLTALEALPIDPRGLLLYPTLMPTDFRPLLALADVDQGDLMEYGRDRHWTDFECGRIFGAAQFMAMQRATGLAEWQHVLDEHQGS